MIRISWATFRERWPLFVGAIVAVAVGVALVQASLLTLISAATPSIATGLPRNQELLLRDGYDGAVSLAGMMTGISASSPCSSWPRRSPSRLPSDDETSPCSG